MSLDSRARTEAGKPIPGAFQRTFATRCHSAAFIDAAITGAKRSTLLEVVLTRASGQVSGFPRGEAAPSSPPATRRCDYFGAATSTTGSDS